MKRVALVSQSESGLQIHALEFGATYDEEGHVWSGAPRDAASAAVAGGGFLTWLGNEKVENATVAEVYTFPDNALDRSGVVRLSVEAEVTAFNCDTEVVGQSIERDASGMSKPVSLTVSMPNCMANGEYLVLKNLLRDMKIASN